MRWGFFLYITSLTVRNDLQSRIHRRPNCQHSTANIVKLRVRNHDAEAWGPNRQLRGLGAKTNLLCQRWQWRSFQNLSWIFVCVKLTLFEKNSKPSLSNEPAIVLSHLYLSRNTERHYLKWASLTHHTAKSCYRRLVPLGVVHPSPKRRFVGVWLNYRCWKTLSCHLDKNHECI